MRDRRLFSRESEALNEVNEASCSLTESCCASALAARKAVRADAEVIETGCVDSRVCGVSPADAREA